MSRDYLRPKRSMIYAGGDSCGKSQATVSAIRGKWMHSLDKRVATIRNAAATGRHPAAPPPPPAGTFAPGRSYLRERAMIKPRRGDAFSLRRKNYGAGRFSRETRRSRNRAGFLIARSLDCKPGGSAGASAIRKRARTFTIGKLAGR